MTETALVDQIGLIAGALWLGGAVYWQLLRDCPQRYSLGMFLVGASLIMGSSALVLGPSSRTAIVLAMIGNSMMLALAIVVHVYLSQSLTTDNDRGNPSA